MPVATPGPLAFGVDDDGLLAGSTNAPAIETGERAAISPSREQSLGQV